MSEGWTGALDLSHNSDVLENAEAAAVVAADHSTVAVAPTAGHEVVEQASRVLDED